MLLEIDNENFLFESNLKCNFSIDFDFKSNPYRKYILYVKENVILGFLSYEDIYDRFEIDNLYVEVSNRRRGIAELLLKRLIFLGKKVNIKNITLEVNEKNIPAINLYEKNGFEKKAIRERYYNGIDGILMEKEMI